MSRYPEHDKLAAVQAETHAVSGFLDWLSEKDWVLARYSHEDDTFIRVGLPPEELLAEWKGLDLDVLEAERRAMLAAVREGEG